MSTVLVRSIGGYEGSIAPHPQRQLDAALQAAGYRVEALELPNAASPDFKTCMAFLQSQFEELQDGILILHSLSSRLFFLIVEQRRRQGNLMGPCVDTAVLLAPANSRYIADWVPAISDFFAQDIRVPCLEGAARRLLIAASDNDIYWEEATTDLLMLQRQQGVDVLLLAGQGHLNDPQLSGSLPDVQAWIQMACPR